MNQVTTDELFGLALPIVKHAASHSAIAYGSDHVKVIIMSSLLPGSSENPFSGLAGNHYEFGMDKAATMNIIALVNDVFSRLEMNRIAKLFPESVQTEYNKRTGEHMISLRYLNLRTDRENSLNRLVLQ